MVASSCSPTTWRSAPAPFIRPPRCARSVPGAGTPRGVFTTTEADGTRKFDAEGWEAAIQQVLAACKEFNVQCGYPATENDIETRIKQGFSVFIMNWGDPGFHAIDIGSRVTGR